MFDKLEEYQDYLFETSDMIKHGLDSLKDILGNITGRFHK